MRQYHIIPASSINQQIWSLNMIGLNRLCVVALCVLLSCLVHGFAAPKSYLNFPSQDSGNDAGGADFAIFPPVALSSAHCMTSAECLESLNSNVERGLSTQEVQSRQDVYGLNVLPLPPTKSIFKLILEQFQDKLVQVLLFVAMLSAALAVVEKDVHAIAEPFIIVLILTLNACVGIWQSKSATDSLEALKKLQPATATALRDGVWVKDLPTSSIVPGDIICLRVGDRVPADARVIDIQSSSCSTDEGSLTGESATVGKTIDPVDVAAPISEKTNMVSLFIYTNIFLSSIRQCMFVLYSPNSILNSLIFYVILTGFQWHSGDSWYMLCSCNWHRSGNRDWSD